MGTNNYKPLQTGYSRVFLIEGRARGDHRPEYFSSLKMGAVSQSFGDVTKIEMPDPDEYGKYVEVDRIRGAMERATFSLMGRYAAAMKSRILTLGRKGCPVDIQLHVGECTDPSNFNVYTKAIIAEDALVISHSTDDLGSLESGEGAQVNETGEFSSTDYYEVMPLSYAQRASSTVTNAVNDVTVFDAANCGSCTGVAESDGCQRVFAVTNGAGGSPTTPPDILYSADGGSTWIAHDVDTLLTAENADAVAGVGDYIVVLSNTANSLSYALVQDFVDGIDPVFTEVTTGFVTAGKPNAIFSLGRKSFIVGDAGYVYYTEDPTGGVTVLDAGAATVSKLNAVHAFDEENAVAVGNDGSVIYTTNQTSWDVTLTKPVGTGAHLTGVYMKSKTEWWVTASNGKMFYTLNSGKKWTEKTLPGTTPSKMSAIRFSTASVGYAAGVVSSRGRLYRTIDGGYSWVVESSGMPALDEFYAIATCSNDANMVVAVGLNDNASDGIIVAGS